MVLLEPCAVLQTKPQDPACTSYSQALLYYKGYHAIQTQRIAHALWMRGQKVMAVALQSRMSEVGPSHLFCYNCRLPDYCSASSLLRGVWLPFMILAFLIPCFLDHVASPMPTTRVGTQP